MVGSISTSDLIMDVVRAAEPSRERATIHKLASLETTGSFASSLEHAARARPSLAGSQQAAPMRIIDAAEKTIGRAFEAAVLTSLLQNILPASSKNTFGSGAAGNAFRSMLAEQLSAQVTAAGGIGIAGMIDRSNARKDAANIANDLA